MYEMRFAAEAPVIGVDGRCHAGRLPLAREGAAEHTVFTDRAMRARLCQPVKSGDDWRRVCTPLDQIARPVRPRPAVPQPPTAP